MSDATEAASPLKIAPTAMRPEPIIMIQAKKPVQDAARFRISF